jgi:hypothetical protein
MKIQFPTREAANAHIAEQKDRTDLSVFTLQNFWTAEYEYYVVTPDEVPDLEEQQKINSRPRREDYE